MVVALPTGTVTFLFTDIEGSTKLLQLLGDRYSDALGHHSAIIRAAVRQFGGVEVSTEGDAFFVSFASAVNAVAAAVTSQRTLYAAPWPPEGEVRVRMGLHTGEGILGGDNYVGLDVNRAARIAAAGHGGQILISATTHGLVMERLPAGTILRDLGEHRLKDLSQPEHLWQLSLDGRLDDFPPLRSQAPSTNLPHQLTSFVGRSNEVAELVELVTKERLLTLTGPGGTGKTRLSIQVGRAASDRFRDGVCFVPLAAIDEPDLVFSAISTALAIPSASGRPQDRIEEFLALRNALLILDNFEQVLQAGPGIVEMLSRAPETHVMVTSRAPLRVSGEQEFSVPPLTLPDPTGELETESLLDLESVALFVDRAKAVKPDFSLGTHNATAVAEIVAQLDGLPLAIELAAARIKLLSPEAMVSRLHNRLALLTGGARDLPTRQQTLRGTIAWSHDLLDEPARRLFWALGVFRGGAELAQVEAIVGPLIDIDPLVGLAQLVDQSLVRQSEASGEPRFWMLETIREFAIDRLGESGLLEPIERSHATVLTDLAEQAAPHLTKIDQKPWLDRLEVEHDNMRAGLAWAIEHQEADLAMRLGSSLWRFWQIRGHIDEGVERMRVVLGLPNGDPRYRSQALEAAGGLAWWHASIDEAERFYLESLHLEEGLGENTRIANALYNYGLARAVGGEPDDGIDHLHRALMLYTESGDDLGIASVEWGLGTAISITRLNYQEALVHFQRALSGFQAMNEAFMLGWSHRMVGLMHARLGDPGTARFHFRSALEIFAPVPDVPGVVMAIRDFAESAIKEGRLDRALTLVGAMAALERRSGSLLTTAFFVNQMDGLEGAVEEAGSDRAERLFEIGRSFTIEEAVRFAAEEEADDRGKILGGAEGI